MKLNLKKKKEVIQNATQEPKVYYGLHFADGVAYYKKTGKMIYVSSDMAKKMDKTFAGKPLFVFHNSDWELENIQEEADGYVIESFFNPCDGFHWAKFIVVSDKGHDAISKGWTLSNGYEVVQKKGQGTYHGIDYDEEYVEGIYNHLAIVPDPRYEESRVLTPEQFKVYNETLKAQNSKEHIINSKENSKMKFNFFTKEKVENSDQLRGVMVTLPKSKREILVENALDELDKKLTENNTVDVDGNPMTLNELKDAYDQMLVKNTALESEIAEYKKVQNEKDEEEKKKIAENQAEEEEKKKTENNSDKEKEKEENRVHNSLMGVEFNNNKNSQSAIYVSSDRIAKGKELF